MQALLRWLDQVGPLGRVTETDSRLSIDLPENVLDQPAVADLLAQAGALLLPPEVFLVVAPPERQAPLLLQDVELPDGLVPCPGHEPAYAALLQEQTDNRCLAPWSRLAFLRTMAACPDCAVGLQLRVVLDKEFHWRRMRGHWPDAVDSKLWFYPAEVAEQTPPEQYLTWRARPLVLGVRGEPPLQSNYVTCVGLDAGDFVRRAAAAAEGLAPRAKALAKQMEDRRLTGEDAGRILPPEYWVSHEVLAVETFPEPLPLPGLFLLSLLGQVCNRVTREAGETYLFQAEGARPMSVRCRLTASGVLLDEVEHVLTPAVAAELIHFYRETMRGKPQGQNRELLQQAVRMAGEGRLSRLVTGLGPTLAYYDFQWKTLAGARFKEQVDLVKSYLGAVQTARGRVTAAMDELYKNLTTVVSGAAAVAAVLLTAAVTKSAQISDYLLISGVLIAFPYIPIHVLRAASLVSAANNDLDEFQKALQQSADELSFPLQVLKVQRFAEDPRADLHRRIRITALWLGIIAMLGVLTALAAYSSGQSGIKKLLPPWAVLLLIAVAGAVPIAMLISLWPKKAGSP
ncbi:MAG TPA: hypothetical protein VD969_09680 [Symbiobacteriaceae bacterium]|nr:hypothetical protein [Symbiobacteriaceae bacterium]